LKTAEPHANFERELRRRIGAVFHSHPELYDHRPKFPWLVGCLGDIGAAAWFVAENPSLTQMERAVDATPNRQWNVSAGDKLFREQLVKHGFKTGAPESPGGWRCYITDVIKSADHVIDWTKRPSAERRRIAEAWAPVLAWELRRGRPRVVATVGAEADRLLTYLRRRDLIPSLPQRVRIDHYTYVASRPDARTGLGPRHPKRIATWSDRFAEIARLSASLDR
jgi:Uracil DNA glycosylase superfamily